MATEEQIKKWRETLLTPDVREKIVRFVARYLEPYREGVLSTTSIDEAAKDLAQDAILKALDALTEFRGGASLVSWLTTIACNVAKNWLRHYQLRKLYPLDAPPLWGEVEDLRIGDLLTNGINLPEETCIGNEGYREGLVALETVAKRHPRDFSALVCWVEGAEDDGYEIAAKRLGIPVPAFKSRLSRVRKCLRDELRRQGVSVPDKNTYQRHVAPEQCEYIRRLRESGLSNAAIARILGVSSFTVAKRLRQACNTQPRREDG